MKRANFEEYTKAKKEIRVTELRELFNQFFAEVSGIVLEDTSLYV